MARAPRPRKVSAKKMDMGSRVCLVLWLFTIYILTHILSHPPHKESMVYGRRQNPEQNIQVTPLDGSVLSRS